MPELSSGLEQSNRFFHEECERLERWAEDMVLGAEKELADTKAQLKALGRQARLATTTGEQHALQLRVRELEKLQRRQRQRVTLRTRLRTNATRSSTTSRPAWCRVPTSSRSLLSAGA